MAATIISAVPGSGPERVARYAYATSKNVIITPGRILATIPPEWSVRQLEWSPDGNRLAWLMSSGTSNAGQIVLASTRDDGATQTWACVCERIAFRGGALVSDDQAAEKAELLTYPETGDVGRLSLTEGNWPPLSIVGATGQTDGIVLREDEKVSGGPQRMYRLGADGRFFPLAISRGSRPPIDVTFDREGGRMAYVAHGHGGICNNNGTPVILDLASGRQVMPEPPPLKGIRRWHTRAIWFDLPGDVYASLIPGPDCADTRAHVVEPEIYRLHGDQWIPTGDRAIWRDYGPDGRHLTLSGLVRVDTVGITDVGPFTLEPGGVGGVTAVAWSPTAPN
ncbi:hypothetical protein [Herbidospora sp. RD11066]